MPVEIWDSRFLSPEQALAIGGLINQTWPKPDQTAETRAARQIELGRQHLGKTGPAPRSIVVVEEDRVVAHASIFPRVIGTQRGEMLIGALAAVCTDAALRGHGLGELVVRAAFGAVDAGEYECSLFQTTPTVRPFYERFGCVVVENLIVNSLADDPEANPFWSEVIMRYPAREHWPKGKVDLRGPGY
jgi:predicted N-acetyltransferase YhbS